MNFHVASSQFQRAVLGPVFGIYLSGGFRQSIHLACDMEDKILRKILAGNTSSAMLDSANFTNPDLAVLYKEYQANKKVNLLNILSIQDWLMNNHEKILNSKTTGYPDLFLARNTPALLQHMRLSL